MRRSLRWCAFVLGSGIALASVDRTANATADDPTEKRERCATRVSIALFGKSASPALFSAPDPQAAVDGMLSEWDFVDRFSRFLNSAFNDAPGDINAADAPYFVATRVLRDKKPYEDLFLGNYLVVLPDPDVNNNGEVRNDADGLGYFHSPFWADRYAGNEENGVRLRTAYRILNNVVGLDLAASTAAQRQGVEPTATGRQSGACRSCHYEHWYALDKVAGVLGKVRLDANGEQITKQMYDNKQPHIQFAAPGATLEIAGKTVHDDRELVAALVASPAFAFNACRLAFRFLYGRGENQCEGSLFDRCVDAFAKDGMIQTAVATVAKDPSFCQ